jgi:ATP-dependent Clp protease ATP-binding subunit ClpA
MIYGKFTKKAETALNLAREFAQAMGHSYIGTEHILWGLVKEGTGVAASVLAANEVNEARLSQVILELVGRGEAQGQPVQHTPRTKRVLELAYAEARRMGQNFIGTEHILLALIREGESVAVRMLGEMASTSTSCMKASPPCSMRTRRQRCPPPSPRPTRWIPRRSTSLGAISPPWPRRQGGSRHRAGKGD